MVPIGWWAAALGLVLFVQPAEANSNLEDWEIALIVIACVLVVCCTPLGVALIVVAFIILVATVLSMYGVSFVIINAFVMAIAATVAITYIVLKKREVFGWVQGWFADVNDSEPAPAPIPLSPVDAGSAGRDFMWKRTLFDSFAPSVLYEPDHNPERSPAQSENPLHNSTRSRLSDLYPGGYPSPDGPAYMTRPSPTLYLHDDKTPLEKLNDVSLGVRAYSPRPMSPGRSEPSPLIFAAMNGSLSPAERAWIRDGERAGEVPRLN